MKRVLSIKFRCYRFLIFIIFSISTLLPSCKKGTEPSEPVIELISPADSVIINTGDSISINGTVSDNKSLHELYFTLQNTTNDSILLYDHPYTHGVKEYYFSYIWFPSITGVYKFTVDVHDHDENNVYKDFLLTVN